MPKRRLKTRVGIVMGSESDRGAMEEAARVLEEFGVGSEVVVRSAHRTPDATAHYAKTARGRGIEVIIAGAGGAAHLAGAMAAHSRAPVLGVPLASSPLAGFDAWITAIRRDQTPAGIAAIVRPVAIRVDGKARPVLPLDQLRDQPADHVAAQIVRQIAEADRAWRRHRDLRSCPY